MASDKTQANHTKFMPPFVLFISRAREVAWVTPTLENVLTIQDFCELNDHLKVCCLNFMFCGSVYFG